MTAAVAHLRPAGDRDRAAPVPSDLEAERMVLGAAMLDTEAVADLAPIINAGDFWHQTHAAAWEAIVALDAERQPTEPAAVARWLADHHRPHDDQLLLDALAAAPTATTAPHYARRVADLARQRRLMAVAVDLANMARQPTDDVDALLDDAAQAVYDVCETRSHSGPHPLGPGVLAHLDIVEARHTGAAPTGTPTGWPSLDAVIGGLTPGQLVVVAARPSVGKTAVVCALARQAAGAGAGVLVASLEMSVAELHDRWLAAEAGVSLKNLTHGRLGDRDLARVSGAAGALAGLPVVVDDDAGASVVSLRSSARRARRTLGRVDVVIVDYLQLMAGRRNAENRQVQVAEMSRGLKLLARDLGCAVVAATQLNRQVELRRDRRPQLADLRESGAIENDADVVIGLYRDLDRDRPLGQFGDELELLVLKQRNGPLGTVRLAYTAHTGRIAEMTL